MTPDRSLVRLSEMADLRAAKIIPSEGDTRPYVALEHLAQGRPTVLGWSRAGTATSAKTVFRKGDVLFGKLRPNLRKAAAAPFDGLYSTDILPLFGKDGMDAGYLLQLAQWHRLQRHAVATSSGTKMPRTSWRQLGEFTFSLPPLPHQRKIAAILSSVDDAIEKTRAVIDQVQVVKRGLMQELLTRGIPGRHTRFKQTEIGEIPEEWSLTTVGSLTHLSGGHGFRPDDWSDSGLPIIRIQNLNGSANFNYFAGIPDNDWGVEPGELLFAWAGSRGASFGPCIWPGPRGVLNQHIYRIKPTMGVEIRFIFHFLSQITAAIERKAHGFKHTLVHLRKSELTNWKIGLPLLEEQQHISRVIDAVEHRVTLETEKLHGILQAKSALMSVLLTGELRVTPDPDPA